MKRLKITTIREMSDEDFEVYKEQSPIQPNWDELEQTGKTVATTHIPGEKVASVYELEEV